jgi:radical SAM superfamily enzyme YgiQ (UPF0313 family)
MMPLKVLLIYPEVPQTFWSLTHALRFFGKRAYSPPLGLLTVAAMLPPEWEQRILDLNVHPLRQEDLAWADYVVLSAMNIQQESSRRIIDRCKRAGVKVVLGEPLFTSEPERFRDVEHLVLNEAEVTLPGFLVNPAKGEAKPLYTSTEFADVRASPLPACHLLQTKYYGAMSVQFSRRCPYQCDFCDVTTLFGRRPRIKNGAQAVAERDNTYRIGWRGKIYFVDDNLMGNRPVLKNEFLPAISGWKRGKRGISFPTVACPSVSARHRVSRLRTRRTERDSLSELAVRRSGWHSERYKGSDHDNQQRRRLPPMSRWSGQSHRLACASASSTGADERPAS